MGSCDLPYGLIRSQALKNTRLYATHLNSDHHLMLELLLQGPFAAVPEYHFFRRWYPEAGGHQEEGDHYDPLAASSTFNAMTTWQGLGYNLQSIVRSSLSPAEKRKLLLLLLRDARWDRWKLCGELWQVAVSPFRRAIRS
jgi:hypothetical protein